MTEQLFTAIAKEHLSIETLETRRSDSLDFRDVSVWGVRAALEAAYKAGPNAERNAFRRSTITVLENCIEKAGDLYVAIDGVTDQFDDGVFERGETIRIDLDQSRQLSLF
jgi:hypothetical protein